MAAPKMSRSDRMVTPTFRASYANFFTPRAQQEGKEAKYSVLMLFPKTEDITHLKAAAKAVLLAQFGANAAEQVKAGRIKWPFRDGDTDYTGDAPSPEKKGHIFVNCSAKTKPQIVGPSRLPITDPEEIGSGDYCRASITFFAYEQSGNRGVGVGLGNVQLVRRGERLAGGPAAVDEFSALEALPEGESVAAGDFGDL